MRRWSWRRRRRQLRPSSHSGPKNESKNVAMNKNSLANKLINNYMTNYSENYMFPSRHGGKKDDWPCNDIVVRSKKLRCARPGKLADQQHGPTRKLVQTVRNENRYKYPTYRKLTILKYREKPAPCVMKEPIGCVLSRKRNGSVISRKTELAPVEINDVSTVSTSVPGSVKVVTNLSWNRQTYADHPMTDLHLAMSR